METPVSVPVIWVENDGPQLAGRVDLTPEGVHLDGGSRASRRTLDVPYGDIASVRVGPSGIDRIDGRRPLVLGLHSGATVSFVAFDRPGAILELAHQLEARL